MCSTYLNNFRDMAKLHTALLFSFLYLFTFVTVFQEFCDCATVGTKRGAQDAKQ